MCPNFNFAVFQILMNQSLQIFAYDMAAVLSVHLVQYKEEC